MKHALWISPPCVPLCPSLLVVRLLLSVPSDSRAVDNENVLDATKKGNLARFINHSCDVSSSVLMVLCPHKLIGMSSLVALRVCFVFFVFLHPRSYCLPRMLAHRRSRTPSVYFCSLGGYDFLQRPANTQTSGELKQHPSFTFCRSESTLIPTFFRLFYLLLPQPNCFTRIITVNGQPRVVIYAKRAIQVVGSGGFIFLLFPPVFSGSFMCSLFVRCC